MQLHLFATKTDMESLLRAVESQQPLQFVLTGLFDSPTIERVESLLADPNLGQVEVGDQNHTRCYLVARREISIELRSVPQRRGGIKYAVDQLVNPKTISFRPGGAFGEMCLIAGQVGTVSNDSSSVEIFKRFSKEIQHQFTKIKGIYVGKEAAELLDKGGRLTTNVKSPTGYDLKRG